MGNPLAAQLDLILSRETSVSEKIETVIMAYNKLTSDEKMVFVATLAAELLTQKCRAQ